MVGKKLSAPAIQVHSLKSSHRFDFLVLNVFFTSILSGSYILITHTYESTLACEVYRRRTCNTCSTQVRTYIM